MDLIYCRYVLFWLVILGAKFCFTFFLQVSETTEPVHPLSVVLCNFDIFLMQIRPLVKPTRAIVNFTDLKYSWHDLVSKGEKAFQACNFLSCVISVT